MSLRKKPIKTNPCDFCKGFGYVNLIFRLTEDENLKDTALCPSCKGTGRHSSMQEVKR